MILLRSSWVKTEHGEHVRKGLVGEFQKGARSLFIDGKRWIEKQPALPSSEVSLRFKKKVGGETLATCPSPCVIFFHCVHQPSKTLPGEMYFLLLILIRFLVSIIHELLAVRGFLHPTVFPLIGAFPLIFQHGLRALAQSMARELGPRGVHVAHVVIDGAIDTAWIRENFPGTAALKVSSVTRRLPELTPTLRGQSKREAVAICVPNMKLNNETSARILLGFICSHCKMPKWSCDDCSLVKQYAEATAFKISTKVGLMHCSMRDNVGVRRRIRLLIALALSLACI